MENRSMENRSIGYEKGLAFYIIGGRLPGWAGVFAFEKKVAVYGVTVYGVTGMKSPRYMGVSEGKALAAAAKRRENQMDRKAREP